MSNIGRTFARLLQSEHIHPFMKDKLARATWIDAWSVQPLWEQLSHDHGAFGIIDALPCVAAPFPLTAVVSRTTVTLCDQVEAEVDELSTRPLTQRLFFFARGAMFYMARLVYLDADGRPVEGKEPSSRPVWEVPGFPTLGSYDTHLRGGRRSFLDSDGDPRDMAATELIFALAPLVFCLMHTRTTEIEEKEVPPMWRPKHKSLPPRLTYRILRIDQIVREVQVAVEGATSRDVAVRRALHQVRGHFMRHFGGISWRRTHWRGDPSKGMVLKDYRLPPDPELPPDLSSE